MHTRTHAHAHAHAHMDTHVWAQRSEDAPGSDRTGTEWDLKRFSQKIFHGKGVFCRNVSDFFMFSNIAAEEPSSRGPARPLTHRHDVTHKRTTGKQT